MRLNNLDFSQKGQLCNHLLTHVNPNQMKEIILKNACFCPYNESLWVPE